MNKNSYFEDELVDIERLQEEENNFKVENIDQLNFVFRKITALKYQESEVMALANKERERINLWVEKQLVPINNSISFFESHAKSYHQREYANDPKKKKISTPYGAVKTRTSKEAPEQTDPTKLLEYAFENGLDECIKSEVRWAEVKKKLRIVEISGEKVVVDGDGQIVPGISIKPETIDFKVETEDE